jgi:hypothetical protein
LHRLPEQIIFTAMDYRPVLSLAGCHRNIHVYNLRKHSKAEWQIGSIRVLLSNQGRVYMTFATEYTSAKFAKDRKARKGKMKE